MSKIYKSWELIKAIADGKIKNGSKFIFKTVHNMKEEVLWDGEVFLYANSGKTIVSDYTDIKLIQGTFELIENKEEINIDSIEEIKWTEINGTGNKQDEFILEKNGRYICANYDDVEMELVRTINELIKVVKQIDKRVMKLED